MAVVSILVLRLTGSRRQQVLQGPKTVLDPVAPLPRPDEPRRTDGGLQTHYVELLLPGCTDHDERHRAIRRTDGPQPRIAYTRNLGALTPGPSVVLLQVVALDLAPICQIEDIGAFSFYQEGALVGGGHMAHEFRITKPTIGHDHRRGELDAAPAQGGHASIEHDLHPVQFVAARRPSACGVGTPDGEVHGHHEFTLTND